MGQPTKNNYLDNMKFLVVAVLVVCASAAPATHEDPIDLKGNVNVIVQGGSGVIDLTAPGIAAVETAFAGQQGTNIPSELEKLSTFHIGQSTDAQNAKLRADLPSTFNDYIKNPDGSLTYILKGPSGTIQVELENSA